MKVKNGRVVIVEATDGSPRISREMTPYERLCQNLKAQGADPISESEANMLLRFLGDVNGTDVLLRFRKKV